MGMTRIIPHMYLFTPLGPAEAHFLWSSDTFEVPISYGCFISETKENWWWSNTHVRICESVTAIRSGKHSPIYISDDLFEELKHHIKRHTRSPFYERAAISSSMEKDKA